MRASYDSLRYTRRTCSTATRRMSGGGLRPLTTRAVEREVDFSRLGSSANLQVERYWTIKQAAAHIGVSSATFQDWVNDGKCRGVEYDDKGNTDHSHDDGLRHIGGLTKIDREVFQRRLDRDSFMDGFAWQRSKNSRSRKSK